MKVPQFVPWIGKEEYEGLANCFDTGWITEGPRSNEFLDRLLKLSKTKYGVFAPSGTLAIYLGLIAMGIGPGDEVIVPDFTFVGTATAVQMTGALPVFVDVNRENFQINVNKAATLVNHATKAVIPVHIYGTAANMDTICDFARRNNLLILEDAAQGIGVNFKGKHVGGFGNTGIFSFFADKTITTGEGGMVITNDEKIYKKLLYLRNQGRKDRGSFIHPEIGYNFRLTDIQCAIGLVQLNKLNKIVERKLKIENQYKDGLKDLSEIVFFKKEPNANLVPFRVGILCERAHELMKFMQSRNIEPRTFFYPLHKQPCFSYLKKNQKFYQNMKDKNFVNAIYGYENGICLPSFPTIDEEQIEYVCSIIKEFYKK